LSGNSPLAASESRKPQAARIEVNDAETSRIVFGNVR
jgi:hypothetical protein